MIPQITGDPASHSGLPVIRGIAGRPARATGAGLGRPARPAGGGRAQSSSFSSRKPATFALVTDRRTVSPSTPATSPIER